MAIKYDAPNEAVKNCSWNPPEDESGRVCCGDGEAICSNCASVRDRWLARLIEEDRGGRSRSIILSILDTHRSLVDAREAITSIPLPGCEEGAKDWREEVLAVVKPVATTLHVDAGHGEDREEERWQRRRMEVQDERRDKALEERQRRRRALESDRASGEDASPAVPIPENFIALVEATRSPSTCSTMERIQGEEAWGWGGEGPKCWKCGQARQPHRDRVVPLIIGGRDHLMRAQALPGYKSVVCVPVIYCPDAKCMVGCFRTISGVLWKRHWVELDQFLGWSPGEDGAVSVVGGEAVGMGAGNEVVEIAGGLNRGRVILHLLHWFSRGHENRLDNHAGLPPPGVSRPCAIVLRDKVACGYSTFTLDLELLSGGGIKLPTLYNVFVRSSHRYRGCARQLLCAFFRFQSAGKRRFRLRVASEGTSKPTLTEDEVGSISEEVLPFYDKLQIDPPVSNALVSTLGKIFTAVELDNMVADVGDMESGCITYSINPCEPKVRMFRPYTHQWIADTAAAKSALSGTTVGGGCGASRVVVIGGICQ